MSIDQHPEPWSNIATGYEAIFGNDFAARLAMEAARALFIEAVHAEMGDGPYAFSAQVNLGVATKGA